MKPLRRVAELGADAARCCGIGMPQHVLFAISPTGVPPFIFKQ
jgi:hypothetical protein